MTTNTVKRGPQADPIEVVIAHKLGAHADHIRLVAVGRPYWSTASVQTDEYYADDDIRFERKTNDGGLVYSANFMNIHDAMARFNTES